MIFSIASTRRPYVIVMTVDSTVQTAYRTGEIGRKLYAFDGVGCVATWGDQPGTIGAFLEETIQRGKHSISDLTAFVVNYLKEHVRPHEHDLDPLGYHVAGFDSAGMPRLFHVFWGINHLRATSEPDYHILEAGTVSDSVRHLFNSEDDLAQQIIPGILDALLVEGRETQYDLRKPVATMGFSDFIMRLTAELLPSSAPPFFSCLISPQNKTRVLRNDFLRPLDEQQVIKTLRELEYRVGSVNHEDVVQNTVALLRKITSEGFIFRALANAPAPQVHFDAETVVEPDIFWTGKARGQYLVGDNTVWQGAPNLIIEVLSVDSALIDRRQKFALYEAYGVREYWLIDPDAQYVEVYALEESLYLRIGLFGPGESFFSTALDQPINVTTIFNPVGA